MISVVVVSIKKRKEKKKKKKDMALAQRAALSPIYIVGMYIGSVPCMIPGYILRNEIRVLLHPSSIVLGSLRVISAHPAGVGISNSVFCVLM
ncbi:hypothetical protein F5X96DRAFT_615554 [Biscogniauxia mediterranea]|nr:hypothetical protein F5X96DRAFT_615554 [Biscogniauxia mediterranea]